MSALTAAQRKRHLSNATNLAAHSFDPRYVYTFDFYQHLYDPATFELSMGFKTLKLSDYLNKQPVQVSRYLTVINTVLVTVMQQPPLSYLICEVLFNAPYAHLFEVAAVTC
eukprot:16709-Heterococcus_DN1.PRE.3